MRMYSPQVGWIGRASGKFAAPEAKAKAFGVFYTATIGAGALAPIVFGSLTDRVGLWPMTACIACTALITLPLALALPRTPAAAA